MDTIEAKDYSTFALLGTATREMVRVLADGRVEFGPGVTPDEAARAFWQAVESHGLHEISRLRARVRELEAEKIGVSHSLDVSIGSGSQAWPSEPE